MDRRSQLHGNMQCKNCNEDARRSFARRAWARREPAKAQALILAGLVCHGRAQGEKPGSRWRRTPPRDVRGKEHPWVCRGADQARARARAFGWDVKGRSRSTSAHRPAASPTSCSSAAPRGSQSTSHQPARLEAAAGPARLRPRADECALLTSGIVTEPVDMDRVDASSSASPRCSTRLWASPGRRAARRPGQAAIRGGAARDRQGGVVRDPRSTNGFAGRGGVGALARLGRRGDRAQPDYRAGGNVDSCSPRYVLICHRWRLAALGPLQAPHRIGLSILAGACGASGEEKGAIARRRWSRPSRRRRCASSTGSSAVGTPPSPTAGDHRRPGHRADRVG